MIFITKCEDDALFLRTLYHTADDVKKLMDKVGFEEVRKRLPFLSGEETPEERKAILKKQGVLNAMEVATRMLRDYPEEIVAIMHNMILLEDGEDYPHGVKLFSTIVEMLTDEDIMNFFLSFTKLGQILGAIA